MIFQHTWQKVVSGAKTQTRRIYKSGDDWWYDAVYHTDDGWCGHEGPNPPNYPRRRKYYVGQSLAVQPGRGQRAIGRIRITGIRREDVRDISDEDARAEGFANAMAFWDTWVSMHDKSWHKEFCYAADYGRLRKYGFYDRPAERYDAWVITFTAEAQP